MDTPSSQPPLLELLQKASLGRRKEIQGHWAAPDNSPERLYDYIKSDEKTFNQTLGEMPESKGLKTLILDMVQEFNLPVTLFPEDQSAREVLASRGLIFPFPTEWGIRDNPQWNWVMPIEIAILCAPHVDIYRFSFPLMLGRLPREEVIEIRESLELPPCTDIVEEILQITHTVTDVHFLEKTLTAPQWQEHLFTTQILLEWHGICHQHELFSFAWGDEKVKPLTDRSQRRREKIIEADLKSHGLIFSYSPQLSEDEEEAIGPLVVMAEELRPPIWSINRHLQELLIHDQMTDLGGWSAQPGFAVELSKSENNPTDLLKALVCVLETKGLPIERQDELTGDALATLEHLDNNEASKGTWQSVVELGRLTHVFGKRKGELCVGGSAGKILDGGPYGWSTAALELWAEGVGPLTVDQTQNEALGISQEWLNEIEPLLKRRKEQDKLIGWWRFVDQPETLASIKEVGSRRSRRTKTRTAPSWLRAPGCKQKEDILCGFPRVEANLDKLATELLLVEGVVMTFRLLILDLLGGLSSVITFKDLSHLLQDTMAFAVHLNLPAMFFDPMGQTYIPVRPPTYLIETSHEASFDKLAQELVQDLLAPAGVVTDVTETSMRVLGRRISVKTPRWFDHKARLSALSGPTQTRVEELETRSLDQRTQLRQISGEGESEGRFWLGRSLTELRRAVAGRRITAFGNGYLEIDSRNSTGS